MQIETSIKSFSGTYRWQRRTDRSRLEADFGVLGRDRALRMRRSDVAGAFRDASGPKSGFGSCTAGVCKRECSSRLRTYNPMCHSPVEIILCREVRSISDPNPDLGPRAGRLLEGCGARRTLRLRSSVNPQVAREPWPEARMRPLGLSAGARADARCRREAHGGRTR